MTRKHVFIVEDDDAMRNSLRRALTFEGYVVSGWKSAKDFMRERPVATLSVLVTDMRMPGMSGLELHRALMLAEQVMPIIYISGESSEREIINSMKLKPVDFLLKPFSRESLLAAVEEGINIARDAVLWEHEKARLAMALSQLTPREQSVYQLMIEGHTNAEIMERLAISLPTAKQYKMQVMRKLGSKSLSQLIEFSKKYPVSV